MPEPSRVSLPVPKRAPIQVMVVDDSPFMRLALERIFAGAGDIVVCDAVSSGEGALEHLDSIRPDVITMDVDMPGMGGIEAVRAIMARRRIPIVMLSAYTTKGTETTVRALAYGAADFVAKPSINTSDLSSIAKELVEKVRVLGRLRAMASTVAAGPLVSSIERPASAAVSSAAPPRSRTSQIECIAIGISTGGPAALSAVCEALPSDLRVPILVVQHMPPGFTKPLAERLNAHCRLEVREAEDQMPIQVGRIIIGAAGKQMRVVRTGEREVIVLEPDTTASLYVPSVDKLMASVADIYGRAALGLIMTGMGNDGVEGLRILKDRGGMIWGQDEASSTVYGMPRAAAMAGLLDRTLALHEIAPALTELGRRRLPKF